MTHFDLLEKTELNIERIRLHNANLNAVAGVVADAIGVARSKVLVTDVREDVLTLDLFADVINADDVLGKQQALLGRLSQLPGVFVTEETHVTSRGVLGWIALDEGEARKALERTEKMATEMRRRLSRRAIVFPTGPEVETGQIEDTNTPFIAERLKAEGYTVACGETLRDDATLIAGKLRRAAVEDGYGLIITTGGVGAEDKDHTVEAVLQLSPDASTPYISKFEKGTGRHWKEGVRIAVGYVSNTLIVALPGPNDEVMASLEVLVRGLQTNFTKDSLAKAIAETLKSMLREKSGQWDHGHL
jgi:molybdenum cofactor synthesis domain-containing protein